MSLWVVPLLVRLRLSTVAIARVSTRLSVLTTRIMVLVGYDNNTT